MKKFHVVLTRTFTFEVDADNRDDAIDIACGLPASEAIEEGCNDLDDAYEVDENGDAIDNNDQPSGATCLSAMQTEDIIF